VSVDQIFQEFRSGRRPFPRLVAALREISERDAAGRDEVGQSLVYLVRASAIPGDLAAAIRVSLNLGAPAAIPEDPLDPPTEPRRLAAIDATPAAPGSAFPDPARVLPSDESGSGPGGQRSANRNQAALDHVAITALASDFRRFRSGDGGPPAEAQSAGDRQLDAALAGFRTARLRREAVKSVAGSARPLDLQAERKGEPSIGLGAILKNRFVLDQELGRGGMGIVYRAVDRRRLEAAQAQPYVAVKLMTGDFRRSPDALRALEAEARRAQDLAHPNIVTTFDFDRDGGHPFIVMELLVGRTLDLELKDHPGPMGFESSRAIVTGLCDGLAYAHARGVVHCDLKPANVFLSAAGGVKLMDFGIATAGWAGGFDLASLNAYTIAYASPQMLRGEAREPSDDVYALGCVVYILVAGTHPFAGLSALDAQKQSLRPARPSGLSNFAWEALAAALSHERAERPRTAAIFRDRYFRRPLLQRWLRGA
jgi:hypothetical protein